MAFLLWGDSAHHCTSWRIIFNLNGVCGAKKGVFCCWKSLNLYIIITGSLQSISCNLRQHICKKQKERRNSLSAVSFARMCTCVFCHNGTSSCPSLRFSCGSKGPEGYSVLPDPPGPLWFCRTVILLTTGSTLALRSCTSLPNHALAAGAALVSLQSQQSVAILLPIFQFTMVRLDLNP